MCSAAKYLHKNVLYYNTIFVYCCAYAWYSVLYLVLTVVGTMYASIYENIPGERLSLRPSIMTPP